MKNFLTALIFLFSLHSVFGQFQADSLSLSKSLINNQLFASFEKMLSTSNFNSGINYNFAFSDWNIYLYENFRSTIIKSSLLNIKDEQSFKNITTYNFSDFFQPGLYVKHNIYSDDRNLGFNEASFLNTFFFAKFIPVSKIQLTPYAGWSLNQQMGERDNGPIYGFEGIIKKLDFNDFLLNCNINFLNEDISPRKNTMRFFNAVLENNFQQNISNSVQFTYSQQKRDFYFTADSIIYEIYSVKNNIQERIETNYQLMDNMTIAAFNSNLKLNLFGGVGIREIERNKKYKNITDLNSDLYDSRIKELKLDLGGNLQYLNDDTYADFKVLFSEKEENYSIKRIDALSEILYELRKEHEKQKSNVSQIFSLSGSFRTIMGKSSGLSLDFFHRKIIYDTPSENNNDDRDEVLSIMGVGYSYKISPFFKLLVNLQGSLNHLVYIFKERSANNNRVRSIKLSGGGEFNGSRIKSVNTAEISANYTSYDFEDKNPNLKSYSFRQLAFKDSTAIKTGKNFETVFFGYFKLSEQGDFYWKSFSGRPVRLLNETFLEPQIFYVYKYFNFGTSYRFLCSIFRIL